jgi:electron transport complex protein RnfG
MGTAFVFTEKAKKANEYAHEKKVMLSLLGFSQSKPVPATISFHDIFRYVVTMNGDRFIGYLLPTADNNEESFLFIVINGNGNLVLKKKISISTEEVKEQKKRDEIIQATIGNDKTVAFGDKITVVTDKGKRKAYLLSGKFPGYKSNISIILALDPELNIIGLEIMDNEEDPGLGAEISQNYFKKQFMFKPFEAIKKLDVVKEPLPEDYFNALEGKLDEKQAVSIMKKYKNSKIYALTGATISSSRVTNGIKAMTKKFAYRINVLDTILKKHNISVPF